MPSSRILALANQLEPVLLRRSFKRSGAASFTRRRGTSTDRVGFDAAGRASLTVTDKAVATIAPRWLAGGAFNENTFREIPALDLAKPASAKRFVTMLTTSLPFFDLAAAPATLLVEAQRRYVPGFVDPTTIAPYLRVHLGPDAVAAYVDGMLRGRPELWPAALGHVRATAGVLPDHGSQLATMHATHAPAHALAPPPHTVTSTDPRAANLRAHLGLQLRAWGEPAAAAELRRLDDAAIRDLYTESSRIDDRDYAARVLRAASGEQRQPARTKPSPRYYQYEVLHGPWA